MQRMRLFSMLLAVVVGLGVMTPAAATKTAQAWDFNGDGRRDLAVGVRGEGNGAGALVVLPGTSDGVATTDARRFTQNSRFVPGVSEPGDGWGAALASADFDADGYADLAVGAPGEDISNDDDVGSVTILYGGPNGLSRRGAHRLGRPAAVLGEPDPEEDRLGMRLRAADFDRDGDGDLVVGVDSGPGGVLVYRGRSAGLARSPYLGIGAGLGLPSSARGVPDSLAVGDLDGNGAPDLALGLMETRFARGSVAVVYSAAGHGLDLQGSLTRGPQLWTEDSPGVKGRARRLDAFGAAVGIGDVTGDARQDLVVTVLQQPTGIQDVTGALHVLRGSRRGVTARGDQYLRYDRLVSEPLGALGVALAVGDLNRDSIADVAVTHGTDAGSWYGGVLVAYGDRDGLGTGRVQTITQATPGIGGTERPVVDYWGLELRIRDVGRSRTPDLIASDPYQASGGIPAGMVNVLWGSSRGLAGRRSATLTQATPGVPGRPEDGDLFGSGL